MRLTANYGWPVAEGTDPRRNHPAAIDQPRSDAIDSELFTVAAADYGLISYAGASITGTARLTAVESASAAGVITHDGAGRLTLPDGVYAVFATVGATGSTAWLRAWARTDTNDYAVRGAVAVTNASAGGSSTAAGVIAVTTGPIAFGLWHELQAATTNGAQGTTFLHAVRLGNVPT